VQRILQPGEIESLDHTAFARVRLPDIGSLFLERANRLRQLAQQGNPIADYLNFIARLAQAQHQLAQEPLVQELGIALPDAAAIEQAQRYALPLLPVMDHLDPCWHQLFDALLAILVHDAELSADVRELVSCLQSMGANERDALARRLLAREASIHDVGHAPFVMAALQVMFARRASLLNEHDLPYTDPATICPVCGSEPVASVIRIGGKAAEHRYLHCACCATEWHMVRVKCSHCASTQGINYQGLAAQDATHAAQEQPQVKDQVVLAETCDECGTYRKIVNQEKDPYAEPLADDLGSLTLDLLMTDTAFQRASNNPLLYVAVEETQT